MRRHAFLFLAIFFLGALSLQADTITLKNGRVIRGQVIRFSNGEFVVEVPSSDAHEGHVDRVIILVSSVASIKFDAGGTVATTAGPSEELVVLDSSQEVVATGIELRRGDKVRVRASGEMQFSDGRLSGPKGLDTRANWPFPGERYGVLVAMVGDPNSSVYHVVGEEAEFEAQEDGELLLQINAPSLDGARGAYTARVRLPKAATTVTPPRETFPRTSSRVVRREFEVPADQEWIDTGINVRAGDRLRISAEGTIHYTSSKTCGPNGGKREVRDMFRALPVNDVGRGALIGKLGEGGRVQAFLIGERGEFDVDRDGRLFLGINDDKYDTNSGSFQVTVEIIPRP